MAARKRPSPTSISTESDPTDQKTTHNTSDNAFHLPPLKLGSIFVISTLLCSLHLYLLCFHYKVETQLKHSILINAALSLVGFFVTLKMIHAAARYVLRRNTFRFDINKSGTPQVEVKVLESLGIVASQSQLLHLRIYFYCSFQYMVTMHSLIKLKSQEQKLALPEPALIKQEKACYIDDDCDYRERQRISSLAFNRYQIDTALLFASSELTYAISMFQ